jgi:formylmethanofuran dehydrogenase subunit E
MEHADCDVCRFIGFVSCDKCGQEVHPDDRAISPEGHALCGWCLKDFHEWEQLQRR